MSVKIKLSELRRIISDEVERNMRWSAGMFGGGSGGIGTPNRNVMVPLPGLGDEEKEDAENFDEERESQIAARAYDRISVGQRRQTGFERARRRSAARHVQSRV